jgi:hypothetical protein
METTYEFSAYNTETIYGYGTETEATQYLEWLNQDKEINLYEMGVSDLTDEQADTLAINLRENLADLDLIESGDN